MTKPTDRTCEVDDCNRKHSARGLCAMHWKRKYAKRTMVDVTCPVCLTVTSKRDDGAATRKFCSLICRDLWRIETGNNPAPPRIVSRLPVDHPVRVLIRQRSSEKSALRTAFEMEDWSAVLAELKAKAVSVDGCWLWPGKRSNRVIEDDSTAASDDSNSE